MQSVTWMRVPASGGSPQVLFDKPYVGAVNCAHKPGKLCVLVARESDRLNVYEVTDAGEKGRQLAGIEIHTMFPLFDLSPDGSQLAIVAPEERPARIRVLSRMDGKSRDLALGSWPRAEGITWSADGRGWYTSYASARGGVDLVYIDLEGHISALRYQVGGTGQYRRPMVNTWHSEK
jgi:hypothetical protein